MFSLVLVSLVVHGKNYKDDMLNDKWDSLKDCTRKVTFIVLAVMVVQQLGWLGLVEYNVVGTPIKKQEDGWTSSLKVFGILCGIVGTMLIGIGIYYACQYVNAHNVQAALKNTKKNASKWAPQVGKSILFFIMSMFTMKPAKAHLILLPIFGSAWFLSQTLNEPTKDIKNKEEEIHRPNAIMNWFFILLINVLVKVIELIDGNSIIDWIVAP
jgi:hypothetical protein